MRNRLIWLALIVGTVIGCNRKVSEAVSVIDRSNYKVDSTITDTLVFLSRGYCFGVCPVYEATIFNNGIVLYNGIDNVERNGLHHGRITQEQLDGIIDSVQSVEYFDLPDTFPTAKVMIADLPTSHVMVRLNDERKHILDRGYEDSRKEDAYARWLKLQGLEDYIDAVLETVEFNRVEQLKTDD